jgi:urease accessory protein
MKNCRHFSPLLLSVLAFALAPTLAQADPGHPDGFGAGLAHPVVGWDHLLAMIAVGIWAGQMKGRARWVLPAAFVGLMTLGSALGMAGMSLPFGEAAIVSSVVLFGLLVATAARCGTLVGAMLVGGFAIFHGLAHGAEIPVSASGFAYAAGLSLATAGLHGAGVALALSLQKPVSIPWVRVAGGTIALAGVFLALQ